MMFFNRNELNVEEAKESVSVLALPLEILRGVLTTPRLCFILTRDSFEFTTMI